MLTLTSGDTAPTLTGTVSAILTGAAVAVHIKRPDATVLNKTATIVGDPATGVWSVDWTTGDLSLTGTYYVEAQVTFSNGKIQTFALDATGRRVSFYTRAQIA